MFPQERITETQLEEAQPKPKAYKLAIGGGLYLLVYPTGSKYWRIKYRFLGKENTHAVGLFPQISLSAALKALARVKALLKQGIDPNTAKAEDKKNRPKPTNLKDQFRMAVSKEGRLTIETKDEVIRLTRPQVKALQAFLAAIPTEAEA
jgi:hypothetical protein